MKVNIKKLVWNAQIPKYAHETDAGLDLVAVSRDVDDDDICVYGTGLSVEIPEGYVGLIFSRSSISNYNLYLSNSVGVIDSGYRGEILLKFKKTGPTIYQIGDKIGQLIILPYPKIEFIETHNLSTSDRNENGFGSTGQ